METVRFDRLAARSGQISRREVRGLLRMGRLTADGAVPASPEQKVREDAVVCLDGVPLNCAAARCFLLHKPAGVLSATEDRDQPTVLDLLPVELRRLGLFPAGRLDKDTTGLLLLTNDGPLAHRVVSPKHRVPKVYLAEVDGVLDGRDAAAFASGIVLGDGSACLPALLELAGSSLGRVTVYEGKYHQVKRMFAALGKPVRSLHRERVGGLDLSGCPAPGDWRELDASELSSLFCP